MAASEDHRLRLAPGPSRQCPALFVDRDGTLLDDPGYLADPDRVRLIPGAAGALRRFRDAGAAIVLVTNQSGIARGYYGWADYEAVAERVRSLLLAEGIVLDAEVACGHGPPASDTCGWRKPAPGMVLAAVEALALDRSRSLLCGDKLSDIQAAAAARLGRAAHVLTGHGAGERPAVAAWPSPIPVDLVDGLAQVSPCGS